MHGSNFFIIAGRLISWSFQGYMVQWVGQTFEKLMLVFWFCTTPFNQILIRDNWWNSWPKNPGHQLDQIPRIKLGDSCCILKSSGRPDYRIRGQVFSGHGLHRLSRIKCAVLQPTWSKSLSTSPPCPVKNYPGLPISFCSKFIEINSCSYPGNRPHIHTHHNLHVNTDTCNISTQTNLPQCHKQMHHGRCLNSISALSLTM